MVKVHPEFLHSQKLPKDLITKHIWDQRYEDINSFEKYLSNNGIVVRKFFLNVSKKEQKRRFLSRLDDGTRTGSFRLPISRNEDSGATTRMRTRR